jgi:hypothetical protein
MKPTIKRSVMAGVMIILLVLFTACQDTAAPAPTDTPTDTPADTATYTPSKTKTPTTTSTATDTPTITPTFTPTLPYNAPGTYAFKKCTSYKPDPNRSRYIDQVNLCLTSVTIEDNGAMRFNVKWGAYADANFNVQLDTYAGDTSIVLVDNLENEYRHTQEGGCAATPTQLTHSHPDCSGWFLFPAAKPGATSFAFIDFMHGVSLDNIVLLKEPADTPTPSPTADPNLTYNAPGTYYVYKCAYYPSPGNWGASNAKICLNTVVVNEVYEMKFVVAWTLYFDYSSDIIKPSDANNHAIKVLDNLGNEYHHTQAGGCAAEDTRFWSSGAGSDDCSGWFLFPPPNDGATSLRFVDTESDMSIENIVLVPKTG